MSECHDRINDNTEILLGIKYLVQGLMHPQNKLLLRAREQWTMEHRISP